VGAAALDTEGGEASAVDTEGELAAAHDTEGKNVAAHDTGGGVTMNGEDTEGEMLVAEATEGALTGPVAAPETEGGSEQGCSGEEGASVGEDTGAENGQLWGPPVEQEHAGDAGPSAGADTAGGLADASDTVGRNGIEVDTAGWLSGADTAWGLARFVSTAGAAEGARDAPALETRGAAGGSIAGDDSYGGGMACVTTGYAGGCGAEGMEGSASAPGGVDGRGSTGAQPSRGTVLSAEEAEGATTSELAAHTEGAAHSAARGVAPGSEDALPAEAAGAEALPPDVSSVTDGSVRKGARMPFKSPRRVGQGIA
jgi:hypothetical protein